MFDKLEFIEDKYKDLSNKISDLEIIADQNQWKKLVKEHSDIEPLVQKFREYKTVIKDIEDSEEMLREEEDKELLEMVKMELSDLEEKGGFGRGAKDYASSQGSQ